MTYTSVVLSQLSNLRVTPAPDHAVAEKFRVVLSMRPRDFITALDAAILKAKRGWWRQPAGKPRKNKAAKG